MSEEFTPPRTRREWLMQERARLYKALNDAVKGYDDLVSGAITSYSLGTRSITRYTPDLNALSAFITQTQNRIAEIEAILNGRPIRNTSRYVFMDPSMIGRRW
jgi:hypothetical protein